MARVTVEKVINIKTIEHKTSGLLVATSPDMAGLYVHARSQRELIERIPQAIRAILEADGHKVASVEAVVDEQDEQTGFLSHPTRFQAIAA